MLSKGKSAPRYRVKIAFADFQNLILNPLISVPEPETPISTLQTKTVLPGCININSFVKFLKTN